MGIILKESIVDPYINKTVIREISIDVENLRNRSSLKSYLVAKHFTQNGESVVLELDNIITELLDCKRTNIADNITRLSENYTGNNILIVEMHELFNVSAGDVISISADMQGTNMQFAFVNSVIKNQIFVSRGEKQLDRTYFKGAFVQNLSKNYKTYNNKIGIVSQMMRPDRLPFEVSVENECIWITIIPPMRRDSYLKYYDIYVRSYEFDDIQPEWTPDIQDVGIDIDQVPVKTCDGQNVPLAVGGTYHIAVVGKDRKGFYNANESKPDFQIVLI